MSKNKKIQESKLKNKKTVTSPPPASDSYCKDPIVWCFDTLDADGLFAFDLNREDIDHRFLLEKIVSYGKRTWGEIDNDTHDKNKSKHHYLSVDSLSSTARKRISEKGLDEDSDVIFSFAFTNRFRVIGLRKNRIFHPVWLDPCHQFCPSSRK